jgi:hypothetical protein
MSYIRLQNLHSIHSSDDMSPFLVWKSETVSNKVCIRSQEDHAMQRAEMNLPVCARTLLSFHVVAAVADRTADLIFTRPKGQSACCTLILITGSSLRVNKGIQISSGSLLDHIISRGGGRNERDRHTHRNQESERERGLCSSVYCFISISGGF